MSRILIAGGTGLVGSAVLPYLQSLGHEVKILSRSKRDDSLYYHWNPSQKIIDQNAIEWSEVIINLSGAGIADKKWTSERKKEIINSRIEGLQFLYELIKTSDIQRIISASGVGYYGAVTNEHIYVESDPSGEDFLASTCVQWEEAARKFQDKGVEVCILRFGIILSRKGGALEKMKTPASFGLGAPLGSGKQFMPWIHIHDVSRLIGEMVSLDSSYEGIYNAVAPSYIDNRTFTKAISKVLNKPYFMPAIPKEVLRLVLGEMSTMLIEGSRVSSNKLIESGFQFEYSDIYTAMDDLLHS